MVCEFEMVSSLDFVRSSDVVKNILSSMKTLERDLSHRHFVVLFSLQHYKQGEQFTDILMYLNIAFTILYIVEAGLKFIALRLVSFFFSVMYLVLLLVSRGTKQARARVWEDLCTQLRKLPASIFIE